MKIIQTLVVGASGATGRRLVRELLARGQKVRVIVRSREHFLGLVEEHEHLSIIEASVLELSEAKLQTHLEGCDAVVSCLGHNLSFKGLFGHPRRLVTEATRRLCESIRANPRQAPLRFVLMNTTGNRNRDLDERISRAQRLVILLLRWFLPPHADNEEAADYLRIHIGQEDSSVEWVAVRPDGLVEKEAVTAYELVPSPTRSAIFDAGQTSRINVAHFMAELITNDELWAQWKGQMPVIYNQGGEL